MITISAGQIATYSGTDTPTEARLFANADFMTADGIQIHSGSDWYQSVGITVTDGVVTIASDSFYSTTDAQDNPNVTLTLALYDAKGRQLKDGVIYTNIKIPSTPTTTTWEDVFQFSNTSWQPLRSTYYTSTQIDTKLDGLSTAPNATDVLAGKSRLTKLPVTLADPIAVGDNDTRVVDNLANYGGSLATAASSIGSTKKVLTISEAVTLSADLDLTTTGITLDFATTGKITVASGKTLTIASMLDPGNRQVFAGSGSVRFANGSVPHYNAAWWAGNANAADVTTAINQMIASAAYAGGICKFYFPQLAPVSDGGHTLGNGFIISGSGNYPTAANGYGTTLRLKSSSVSTYLFKVGANTYSGRWENIVLDANGVAADGVLFEANGGANTTSGDFTFRNTTFNGFTRGFVHNSLSSSWQLAQVSMYDCIFQNCTTGIKTNSVNAQLTLVNTNFALGASQKGFDIAMGGLIRIVGGEAAGAITTKTFTDASVNTATEAITINGHGFTNNQEVYLTTTGVLPAGLVSGLLYVIYVDPNTIKLSLTSGGGAINITAAAGGGTHSVNALTAMVMQISGSHGGITFDGFQDEACTTFIQNDASDLSGIINITGGCLVQSKIQVNQSCLIHIDKSNLMSYALQGAPSGGYASVKDCYIRELSVNDGTTVVSPAVLSAMTGGMIVTAEDLPTLGRHTKRLPQKFVSGAVLDGSPTTPVLSALSRTAISEDKVQFRIGRMDASETPDYYYDFYRKYSNGRLQIQGNQTGFVGMDINGDITATKFTGDVETIFDVRYYGAAVDGVTDDTSALSAALTAAIANGGGTIFFPKGTTYINTGGINADFTTKEGTLIFQGLGSSSKIKIAGSGTSKIKVGALKQMIFRDITVIGDAAYTNTMADYFLKADTVDQVLVENCLFAGLRCAASGGAFGGVINAYNCHLTVRNCIFGGCSTYGSGNIVGYTWLSILVESCLFPDYITVGNVYYDVGGNLPSAWIFTNTSSTGSVNPVIAVKNTTWDEGAQHGVYCYNGGSIHIENSFCHNGIGNCVRAESGGKRIDVIDSKIKTYGSSGASVAGIYADGVTTVNVDGLTFENNCNHIQTEGSTALVKIRNSSLNVGATYPTGIRNNAGSLIDYSNNGLTTVANTNYTALASDDTITYTSLSAGRTVNLPTAVGLKGKIFVVKDGAGSAGANNITIDPNGAETIDGAATKAITTNYGSLRFYSTGSAWLTI